MIKPFIIKHFDYKITIKTHKNDVLLTSQKLVTKEFIKKLINHPITAFGYEFNFDTRKIRDQLASVWFDKKDTIRALDFWIEHFLYQNKLDYIIGGTVDDDFEQTLKELIKCRDAVHKADKDMLFTPYDWSGRERDWDEPSKDIIKEDQFVATTKQLLPDSEWVYFIDIKKKKKQKVVTGNIGYDYNKNFRSDGTRYDFSSVDAPNNPDNWIVMVDGLHSTIHRRLWKIVDRPTNITIADCFPTTDAAYEYIQIRKYQYQRNIETTFRVSDTTGNPIDVTMSNVRFQPEDIPSGLDIQLPALIDSGNSITLEVVGFAGEDLRPGDLIYMNIRDGCWYKADGVNQGIRIVTQSVIMGDLVYAVREGTFIFPTGTTPTLRPGDTISDRNGNPVVHYVSYPRPSGTDSTTTTFTPTLYTTDIAQRVTNIINTNIEQPRVITYNNIYIQTIRYMGSNTVDIEFIGENGVSGNMRLYSNNYDFFNHSTSYRLEIIYPREDSFRDRKVLLNGQEINIENINITTQRLRGL